MTTNSQERSSERTLIDLVEPVRTWNRSSPHTATFTYIELSSIDQETKTIARPHQIASADAPSRARQIVATNDVLVATVRPNLNGVARVGAALDGAIASTGFCVLRPKPEMLDSSYLFHWVRTSTFVQEMAQLAKGASYPAVTDKDVLAARIPLPPVAEQQRIAALLDRADALARADELAAAIAAQIPDAMFRESFGDVVNNSMGWPTARLGDVARIVRGASPRPKGDPRYFGGSIPWLLISDVTSQPGMFVTRTREGVTEEGRARSVYVRSGTLILTNSATVGIPKVVALDTCIHDGFLAFVELDSSIQRDFLYWFLRQLRHHLGQLAPMGTQKNLNLSIVSNLRIPIPPTAVRAQFLARAECAGVVSSALRAKREAASSLITELRSIAFSSPHLLFSQ